MKHRDPIAASHSRDLRKNLTNPERVLWAAIRSRFLADLKFRRQHPLGNYILDFYCPAKQLAVELDGDSHQGRADHDARRTQRLGEMGIRVIRFSNDDVLSDLESVLEAILRVCEIDLDNSPNRDKPR